MCPVYIKEMSDVGVAVCFAVSRFDEVSDNTEQSAVLFQINIAGLRNVLLRQ